MKPARFTYHDPRERGEALDVLATHADDAKVLAGGQSLVPLLNMRLAQPAHLVDINRLPDLAYIREVDGGLTFGALTRHRDVEHSSLVRQRCPLLAAAVPHIGHPPIRSRGTIGGSLAHADPAAELPAVLLALCGHVQAESKSGSRTIVAEQLFVDQLQSALNPDELLTEVWLPRVPPRSGVAFLEVSRRHGDYALVGVAAQITINDVGVIAEAHLALFGVAQTAIRAQSAEEVLRGEKPSVSLYAAAAQKASAELDPTTDMHASAEYRRDVARTLIERALLNAAERVLQEVMR